MLKFLSGSAYLPALVGEVKSASQSIWVMMFEWVWYEGQRSGTIQDLNRELAIRARAGLDVKVLLHNESMGRSLHKINRVTARHLRQNGAEVKFGNTGAPLHAKVWIFDSSRVVLGSHNISSRSDKVNIECSLLFDDGDEVGQVISLFNDLWSKGFSS